MGGELVSYEGGAPESESAGAFDPAAFHREAMDLFSEWVAADQHNRDEALDDLNFQALCQWDEIDRQERENARRPCFTVDMTAPFVRQIDGELRRNPLSVKSYPAEGGDVETAQVYAGLWRAIEEASNAARVFSLAGGQAAACGIGHFRGSFEYEHDDTFHQSIRLRSIVNPLAVVRDPSAIMPDNSDLHGCFVYDDIPRRQFKQRWPKAATSPWPGTDSSYGNRIGWFEQDTIRICEYWYVKMVPGELVELSDGQLIRDPAPETLMRLMMQAAVQGRPLTVVNRRRVMRRKVCMVLMSGSEILPRPDGQVAPYEIRGSIIPIFTVEGEVIYIDGKRVRRGLIRPMKDLQVIRNWAKSAEVETTAMAPRQKWIATHAMVKGREQMWRNANLNNTATLLYEPDPKAPQSKPERLDPPEYNNAAARLADRTIDEARHATGMFAANLGEGVSGDSGIKVRSLQQQGDTGNYLYIDNLQLAASAAARWGTEVIPYVYDADRQVRILGEDMEPAIVRVNAGAFDLGRGKYDMRYRIGPSFINARQEAAEGMREALQYAGPQYADIIIRRLAKAQDWPEADDIAREMQERAMNLGQISGPPGAGAAPTPGMPPQNAPATPAIGAAMPGAAMPPPGGNPPVAPNMSDGALPMRANAAGVYEVDELGPPEPMPAQPRFRIVARN